MDCESVLVEAINSKENTVFGVSGIMLNKKYVLTTGNILLPQYEDFLHDIHMLEPGVLYNPKPTKDETIGLHVSWSDEKNSNKYVVKDATVLGFLYSENVKKISKRIFQNWSTENRSETAIKLSLFFVLKLDVTLGMVEFYKYLLEWWIFLKDENINQADEIIVKSVPFGSKHFIDSVSRGIVSNIFGEDSSLIVIDNASLPGSEGGIVYKVNSDVSLNPIGILISSFELCHDDAFGLSLAANIRSLISEILSSDQYECEIDKVQHSGLIASLSSSFVKVYSGIQAGTAIIISTEDGILLTNSHVVGNRRRIKLSWRDIEFNCDLIYKSPTDEVFDLAVLKCDPSVLKRHNLTSIKIAEVPVNTGDCVYAVGFMLLSKHLKYNPMISKGCVAQKIDCALKTTCCVNPGMSGGGILNEDGELLGIIVCSAKLLDVDRRFPRFNMVIPYPAIREVIDKFLDSKDPSILKELHTWNHSSKIHWNYVSKL